jgi:hypothetical protein
MTTTRQELSLKPPDSAGTLAAVGRVAVVAFTKVPHDRLKEYVGFLLARGVPVTMVCLTTTAWREFRDVAHFELLSLRHAERQHLMNVLESILIYDVAGAAIFQAHRMARRSPTLRWSVHVVDRIHKKVAHVLHHKVYKRFYAVVRAQVLSSLGRRALRKNGPLQPLSRIVAADTNSIALGWWLAKRFPDAVATTALERKPYQDLAVIPGVPEPLLKKDEPIDTEADDDKVDVDADDTKTTDQEITAALGDPDRRPRLG